MNRILPNQPSWFTSATPTRPEQGRNFAEALHGKSSGESERTKSGPDHFAETGSPAKTTSLGNGRRATASALESELSGLGRFTKTSDDSGTCGRCGALSDVMLAGMDTDGLSIGLLPGHVDWSRVYPEHLTASGYLSVVDTAERKGNMAFEGVDRGGLGIDLNVDTTTPIVDEEAGVVRDTTTSSSGPLSLPLASLEDQATSAVDTEIASSTRALGAITLADHIWAERLMRLTAGHDGAATVWLRDYGLKESDLALFVSRLILRGRESGFQVGRIVVNGCEVWRTTRSQGG